MKRLSIIATVLVAAVFLVWWLSPTQVVKRRTEKLMSTLTLEEGSGSAARHLNTLAFGNLIAEEVSLVAPTIEEASGDFDRSDLNNNFAWLTTQATFTKFEVVEFRSVEVDGDNATVEAKIEGIVSLRSYRPADGLYMVELGWRKADDGWRLARAKWTESQ